MHDAEPDGIAHMRGQYPDAYKAFQLAWFILVLVIACTPSNLLN